MNPSKPTARSIIVDIIASLPGYLRMGGTGAVYGRGGERRALRANAAVAECEEERPEGDAAVHRAGG